jgi:chromosome segregation ATPase
MRVNNVIKLSEALHAFFQAHSLRILVDVDAAAVARAADRAALCKLVALSLTCVVSCDEPAPFVHAILQRLTPAHQSVIKRCIECLRPRDDGAASSAGSGAASSSSHQQHVVDKATAAELEELHNAVDELRASHDSLQAALDSALGEKRQLLAVVSDLELRVRDAERQSRSAAEALQAARNAPPPMVDPKAAAAAATAAAEEEIAQLRAELEQREAELSAAKRQIEHAQKLERQLLQATDDAELAREATQRATVAEAALARMRDKMDQFNTIKQQLEDATAQLAARADVKLAAGGAADDAGGAATAAEVGRLRAQLSAAQLSLQSRETECARLRTQSLESDSQIRELQQLVHAHAHAAPLAGAATASGGAAAASSWLEESGAANSDAELARLRAENATLAAALAAANAATAAAAAPSPALMTLAPASDESQRLLNEARDRINALTIDKTKLEGFLKTAKQMIRDMRSKEKSYKDAQDASATRDLSATVDELRQQLTAKDDALAKLNARLEESARLAQREQQLMLTAFYEAGLELQRLKGGARGGGGGASQQSFLQRQRAAANTRDRL